MISNPICCQLQTHSQVQKRRNRKHEAVCMWTDNSSPVMSHCEHLATRGAKFQTKNNALLWYRRGQEDIIVWKNFINWSQRLTRTTETLKNDLFVLFFAGSRRVWITCSIEQLKNICNLSPFLNFVLCLEWFITHYSLHDTKKKETSP